jgi:hypothetical protein
MEQLQTLRKQRLLSKLRVQQQIVRQVKTLSFLHNLRQSVICKALTLLWVDQS